MIINGQNLFPLDKIDGNLTGYFIDSFGYVYSQRAVKGQLTKLNGSMTKSGRYYTLKGVTYRADHLSRLAHSHPGYENETTPVPTESSNEILARIRNNSLLAQGKLDVSTPDRFYATDMNTAITRRGVIIASVNGKSLVFGTKPKIHIGEKSWKAEMQRLAQVAPGTKFVALQIVASVVAEGLRWE